MNQVRDNVSSQDIAGFLNNSGPNGKLIMSIVKNKAHKREMGTRYSNESQTQVSQGRRKIGRGQEIGHEGGTNRGRPRSQLEVAILRAFIAIRMNISKGITQSIKQRWRMISL